MVPDLLVFFLSRLPEVEVEAGERTSPASEIQVLRRVLHGQRSAGHGRSMLRYGKSQLVQAQSGVQRCWAVSIEGRRRSQSFGANGPMHDPLEVVRRAF